jgi:hypothetical protein
VRPFRDGQRPDDLVTKLVKLLGFGPAPRIALQVKQRKRALRLVEHFATPQPELIYQLPKRLSLISKMNLIRLRLEQYNILRHGRKAAAQGQTGSSADEDRD